jgi:hypothetical protein
MSLSSSEREAIREHARRMLQRVAERRGRESIGAKSQAHSNSVEEERKKRDRKA